MQNQRPFDEIAEDEYIEGKGYNDGNHNVWIAKTTNPRARKKKKYRGKDIEVDTATFNELLDAGKKKKTKFEDEEYEQYIIENSPING